MEKSEKKSKGRPRPYNAMEVTRSRGFKSNNMWPAENLKFLVDFMQALDVNLADLERKGVGHHTTLAFLFKKDNMLLSLAHKIVEAYDYRMVVMLKDKAEEEPQGISIANEEELVTLYSQGSRLGFLDMYMRMHKISQRKVAGDLHKSPGTVSYWFKTDDINISNLKEFADMYGAEIIVRISK
jgi:hypothetical protein